MDIFQDKDAKISFLQKAIDVVVIVSGEPLLAKPTRIVAGHEPERTNELLQRIGKCCLSKVAPPVPELGAVHTREGDTPGRATRRATPGSGHSLGPGPALWLLCWGLTLLTLLGGPLLKGLWPSLSRLGGGATQTCFPAAQWTA